ncbi:cutinase transcription factor 1 alpha [Diplodia corticola]|uniref:Cutinase transcription factor 1 alpha n=1 Tax=Diplodia corticola TaxID=236234 RepID=A0A1J9QM78_9PEZI|nr:cutinase transcription factor 1 alpha [Diplodia corticola]OJD29576.1 cutinase transcription factor 1 alpha [Diplodia corticola]
MAQEGSFMAMAAPSQPSGSQPSGSQSSTHPSFRRQRASRACEVRCDAASLGVPCTNCTAFAIECRIPTPKRKKTAAKKETDSDQGSTTPQNGAPRRESTAAAESPAPTVATTVSNPTGLNLSRDEKTTVVNSPDGIPSTSLPPTYAAQQATHNRSYVQFMKPKFARAPIKEAGRVAYLGESSNLSLLVHDRYGTTDVVHYPLPENVRGAKARVNELDDMEINILHTRGAFLLPPRALCDELVDAFFRWVAPVVPVINRSRFMRQYRDPKNPPSLLLLQAILLAGSRVCTNPQLMDSSGSTTPAAMTFYKRAKALFDANYEDDRVTMVQALILMGWYWEGPEDVTKNVFYWSRVAIVVAQGSGMHRSVEGSQLSRSDKRLWKRIWWTLFSRDRSVAVALGRPVAINPEDSDVEMISEDDFIEDEPDRPAEYNPDPVHVQFFINYVKLCEIMGLVLSQQYSVASKFRRTNAIDLTHSDMALADWLQHCPKEVYWEKSRHHFWSALLHANYYTTLCLLHRAHMPPAGSPRTDPMEQSAYPSRTIAYQAAGMITSIIESLQSHDELRYTPAFIVYSLFSALIMHVYQMRSSNKSIVAATEQRLSICMTALKDVSRVWLVAKMVHTLFESILGNKVLEDRLQRAAGKRHQKNRPANMSQPQPQAQHTAVPKPKDELKRKFDELDMSFASGPPAPQVSYERSRPQTPAVTPSRDIHPPQIPTMTAQSPDMTRQNKDAFMGPSRSGTRPGSPFNPSFSYPGTPPDLFLVTRDTPGLSQDIWQNFQPDQLFPADTNLSFPNISPTQQHSMVDPQLSRQMSMHAPNPGVQQQSPPVVSGQPSLNTNGVGAMPMAQSGPQGDPSIWAHMDMVNQQQQSGNEETWSNSSRGQPIAPTTLNVEDWYVFLSSQQYPQGFPPPAAASAALNSMGFG